MTVIETEGQGSGLLLPKKYIERASPTYKRDDRCGPPGRDVTEWEDRQDGSPPACWILPAHHPRLVGGARSAKTWLAVENARRLA